MAVSKAPCLHFPACKTGQPTQIPEEGQRGVNADQGREWSAARNSISSAFESCRKQDRQTDRKRGEFSAPALAFVALLQLPPSNNTRLKSMYAGKKSLLAQTAQCQHQVSSNICSGY